MHDFFIGARKKKNRIDLFSTMPVPLSCFGAAIGDGYIHIFGGQKGNTTYNSTYYYQNLTTKQWYTGGSSSSAYYFNDMVYANGPATNGKRVYSEGGYAPSTAISASSWNFTAETNTAGTNYTTGDTGPGIRTEKRILIMPDNDTVYDIGGYNGTATIPWVTRAKISGGGFSTLAPLPKSLNGHVVGLYNGKIYVSCGYSDDTKSDQTAVYVYDITANTWTKIADAPAVASWIGGCLYKNLIIQPLNNNVSSGTFNIAIYNIDKGTWRTKDSGLPSKRGSYYLPDPNINKGVFILGGMQNTYVGATNWEVNARYNQQYLINEDWFYF